MIDPLVDIRTEDAELDREPELVDAADLVASAAESTARRT